ncbi:recombinase family protein [Cupriavidus lacunae]|uniref:Recombinase family protein n=1 Tax=Cupriavidus lacunae TaxID=2666307 RepID=A0A370NPQ2_9BURK|nr:recombinase family protein [Cupriavidus lacunae]RDK07585.1 recombinase family protein [Cupriavidus lacunae]
MTTTFLYSNCADGHPAVIDELQTANKAGFGVDLRHAFCEEEPASVPALQRPRLRALQQQVQPGDAVVSLRLCSLGWSVPEVLATIRRFRLLGVALYCEQLSRDDLAGPTPPEAFEVLRAVAALEGATRSVRVRESLAAAKAMGRQVGRPPKHTPEQRNAILSALAAGYSVSETARRFNTSRQTVLRIRAAEPVAEPHAASAYLTDAEESATEAATE